MWRNDKDKCLENQTQLSTESPPPANPQGTSCMLPFLCEMESQSKLSQTSREGKPDIFSLDVVEQNRDERWLNIGVETGVKKDDFGLRKV